MNLPTPVNYSVRKWLLVIADEANIKHQYNVINQSEIDENDNAHDTGY